MFTKEEIAQLLSNPNVIKCSAKSITYSPEFKANAIRLHAEFGQSTKQIFQDAGFDIQTIGERTPEYCLKRWRKKSHIEGIAGLMRDERGRRKGSGRPRKRGLTDQERIEYLEAKVAYLKAENDFLTKLRAVGKE